MCWGQLAIILSGSAVLAVFVSIMHEHIRSCCQRRAETKAAAYAVGAGLANAVEVVKKLAADPKVLKGEVLHVTPFVREGLWSRCRPLLVGILSDVVYAVDNFFLNAENVQGLIRQAAIAKFHTDAHEDNIKAVVVQQVTFIEVTSAEQSVLEEAIRRLSKRAGPLRRGTHIITYAKPATQAGATDATQVPATDRK